VAENALPLVGSDPVRGQTPALPELASVYWRPRVDARSLERHGRLWTLTTLAHVIPFGLVAVGLMLLNPLSAPVAGIALVQAWMIPRLYAQRGANVVRPKPRDTDAGAEHTAMGLLGDLVAHGPCDLYARTGLLLERGALGHWLIGEAGALLVAPRGRRIHCFCVRVPEESLPPSDRVTHLLLALRADETGFATVANRAFSGASWRVKRRLLKRMRPAVDAAVAAATA
jgi:hypothetical protein